MTPSVTQSQVFAALRQFLLAVLPAGTPVVTAQQNRAAPPAQAAYAVVTVLRGRRLSTNLDQAADVRFTGSIAGTTLTVTAVAFGAITPSPTTLLYGVGVAAGTAITAAQSGSGGAGTYTVSQAQNVSSETMAAGGKIVERDEETAIQIDLHAADDSTGGDMARTVSALLRDEYATTFFAGLAAPLNAVVPLHADEPRQVPFVNDQSQWETRWIVEAMLQVNPVVIVPQDYADSVSVTPTSVQAAFGP